MNIWDIVHHERHALANDLDAIETADWQRQSMCASWTVHDVLAHLVHDAKTTKPGFAWDMLAARFIFDRANQHGVERERRTNPADTLATFRSVADRSTSAPAPRASRLVEVIVHGEDIRRPLGIPYVYPTEAVLEALRYQLSTSESMGGAKERVSALELRAIDADFTWGKGRMVSGPALELLLFATGRPAKLEANLSDNES